MELKVQTTTTFNKIGINTGVTDKLFWILLSLSDRQQILSHCQPYVYI